MKTKIEEHVEKIHQLFENLKSRREIWTRKKPSKRLERLGNCVLACCYALDFLKATNLTGLIFLTMLKKIDLDECAKGITKETEGIFKNTTDHKKIRKMFLEEMSMIVNNVFFSVDKK